MHLRNIAIALLFGLCACNAGEPPQPEKSPDTDTVKGRPLTILTYNIHHSNPPSRPGYIDLNAIAAVIKNSQAEIVGLQEVDVYTERSGKDLHMARQLAGLAGLPYCYFSKAIDYQGGAYGTAILSKYPLSDTVTVMLPAEAGTEQRTLSVATVTLDDHTKIKFANTHLDHTSATNALSQARHITTYLQDETLPIVFTGDFNATPGSDAINHLDSYFTRTCRTTCAPTIPADAPSRTIDFIMYRGKSAFSVNVHQVLQEPYASDHLPVKATLLLP